MKITITGKDLKATEAIKDYVEKKLTRIEKYFEGAELDAQVTIKAEKQAQIAEMYVKVSGMNLKAVTENRDLYASIDKDIDILEGQIRKAKAKREKIQKDSSIKEMSMAEVVHEEVIEDEVIKTLYYDVRPMSIEDAKIKLQERPNNIFYTFINVDSGKTNVIFKLKDSNNYGIVEPEV